MADKLPQLVAGYTEATKQGDSAGDYRCGTCRFYIPGERQRGGCTVVKPEKSEHDAAYISAEFGGCNYYVRGKTSSEAAVNPARVSKGDAGYEEDGPYSCKRCRNFRPPGACTIVEGKIEPDECCNLWHAKKEH